MKNSEKEITFPFENIEKMDRVVNEPARFSIMCYLFKANSIDFMKLLKMSGLTQGNLSFHLKKLEEAQFISVEKKFVNRKPLTEVTITESGKASLKYYKDILLSMFKTSGIK
ncbi:transcriptional regulator [Myxococcota bacterium]|nr:transcriptional regulator [Myxococcota bacterium]MBU1381916.1 transcriptional regulator [Myxococcota bacterium]MBU1497817.1 transcriptional regulator [Myxococcota bacterium]